MFKPLNNLIFNGFLKGATVAVICRNCHFEGVEYAVLSHLRRFCSRTNDGFCVRLPTLNYQIKLLGYLTLIFI